MKKQFWETPSRTVTFPAQFASLNGIRELVGQAARECGLSEKAVYQVKLAVDEACSNIIEHAYGGECQEKIQLTCKVKADILTVVLRDCGRPFNPTQVCDPDLDACLEERQEGDLGFYFMRQLMDEVKFSFAPHDSGEGNCNILTMVKRKEKKA